MTTMSTSPLRSLGYRTDLIFSRFHGEVVDVEGALCIRNPRSPAHYFGNLLVFREPPARGDRPRWEALFAEHIGRPPVTPHRLFGWDVPPTRQPDFDEFLEAGYHLEDNVVMAAPRLHAPPHVNAEAEYRALPDTDDAWREALDTQVASREDGYDEEPYRRFKESHLNGLRAMTRAGLGFWYGAFVEGRLVADLGVFHDGAGLLRFQSVGTHPDFRRRGLCGSLVHFAGEHARTHFGASTLVIVADDHASAKRVYASVGFDIVERQQLLLRRPAAGEEG
ncbi:GNAT family N-acetyltransferase [Deinococcus yavapaiensis]|uniref:Putative GNAT family acetyltransferase n=1 Tax=Deinococcus yavapaiensis KR-236 TaxID=694435 RepID=A0A318S8P9_9DEIO|nr:GNAT family N-acetyltransferase [Deinococcus yavapaiensis]PYE55416.1 putative GNAT family acetyltransferase [Deinococcus yavapaiensis KR-236]